MKIKFKNKKTFKAQTIFSKKIAKKMVNTSYYRSQGKNTKEYEFIENQKIKLSTPQWSYITYLLDYYK